MPHKTPTLEDYADKNPKGAGSVVASVPAIGGALLADFSRSFRAVCHRDTDTHAMQGTAQDRDRV